MNLDPDPASGDAVARLCGWLAELGGRWGLPPEACRVHGYLYFRARRVPPEELVAALGLRASEVEEALGWLAERRLAQRAASGGWQTLSDPWELVSRALEERRARELAPALDLLRSSRRAAAGDRSVATQIDKLLALLDDIAAIDEQVRRLSPAALRRLLAAGGGAARLIGRALR